MTSFESSVLRNLMSTRLYRILKYILKCRFDQCVKSSVKCLMLCLCCFMFNHLQCPTEWQQTDSRQLFVCHRYPHQFLSSLIPFPHFSPILRIVSVSLEQQTLTAIILLQVWWTDEAGRRQCCVRSLRRTEGETQERSSNFHQKSVHDEPLPPLGSIKGLFFISSRSPTWFQHGTPSNKNTFTYSVSLSTLWFIRLEIVLFILKIYSLHLKTWPRVEKTCFLL